MINNKLLAICGPTATGKTKLALYLAKKFNGELISADSRQVYKGMDIGTGKDLPDDAKFQISNVKLGYACPPKLRGRRGNWSLGFYTLNGVSVWGYDLVGPTEEFSVAQYINIAETIINDIFRRQKLPILVGGTGLYIKGVVEGIPTAVAPKSLILREKYKNKTVKELQMVLSNLDNVKLDSMNDSDKNNPRRLIRAIEIAKLKNKIKFKKKSKEKYNTLYIGLTAPSGVIKARIKARVEDRIKRGFFKEVNNLINNNITSNVQSMNAFGYKCYIKHINSDWAVNDIKKNWEIDENKYVKSQMKWFKNIPKVNWINISDVRWKIMVDKLVSGWYSDNNG